MISRKSSAPRPGQVPRWTSQPAKSANTAENAAATTLKVSVLRSASPLVPVATNSKCRTVNVRLVGNTAVKALTTRVPYTRTRSAASARHAKKQADESARGTGGRSIEDARHDNVKKARPP